MTAEHDQPEKKKKETTPPELEPTVIWGSEPDEETVDSDIDPDAEAGPTPPRKRVRRESDPAPALGERLKERELEIEDLRREIAELKDKYIRSAAEMANFRKRLERERTDYIQFALAGLLKELLIILDNFERAIRTAGGIDAKSYQEGIEMIHKQYADLLRTHGVTPIEAPDRRFDPNFQQAIVTEAVEGIEEPEVAEELQKGYWLHDRLLRPAMVKVLVPHKD
jgi:molecular chaperone GrpE